MTGMAVGPGRKAYSRFGHEDTGDYPERAGKAETGVKDETPTARGSEPSYNGTTASKEKVSYHLGGCEWPDIHDWT